MTFSEIDLSSRLGIPSEFLSESFGGTASFEEYDHALYWLDEEQGLVPFARKARDRKLRLWRDKLGSQLCYSEHDLLE